MKLQKLMKKKNKNNEGDITQNQKLYWNYYST